jgi:EmrB/QacA subfamily drug resistance transporter
MSTSVTTRPTVTAGARQRGIGLAVIVSCQLMVGVDSTVVNVALPEIQRGLGFTATGLSWVFNAYLLAFGGLLLLGARAGDILGRRRVFLAGVAVFTVASLAAGVASTGGWLVAARAAQGLGAAIAAPSTLALLMTTFEEGPGRNRALSIYSAVLGAGASLGLILGGVLTHWASWRWVFFVNLPIGLAIAVLAPRYLAEPERHRGRFDLAGAATSATGMLALVYGFIRVASDGWTDGGTVAAFTVATGLLVAFVTIERRAPQPITPLRLLADRRRAGAYLTMLMLPATMFGAFFFLTQFIQEVLRFSPIEAGLAFLPMTGVMFAVVRMVPRVLPRTGARPLLLVGGALIIAADLWLTQVTPDTSYVGGVLGPMVLLGIGAGCSFMPLSTTILAGVAGEDSGAAAGLLQASQWVGGSLGLAVLVTVFGTASRHAATGGQPATEVLAQGIAAAFAGAAVVAMAALLTTYVALKPTPS